MDERDRREFMVVCALSNFPSLLFFSMVSFCNSHNYSLSSQILQRRIFLHRGDVLFLSLYQLLETRAYGCPIFLKDGFLMY